MESPAVALPGVSGIGFSGCGGMNRCVKRWLGAWGLLVIASLTASAGQVIAAQRSVEQPAAENVANGEPSALPGGEEHAPPEMIEQVDMPVTSDDSAASRSMMPTPLEAAMIVAAIVVMAVGWRRRWFELGAAERGQDAMSPALGIALFIGFLILLRAGVALGAEAWGIDAAIKPPPLRDQVKLAVSGYAAQSLAVIAYLALGSPRSAGVDRRRAGLMTSLAVGALAIVMIWPIIFAVSALVRPLVTVLTGQPPDPVAHETLRTFLEQPMDAWYVAMAAIVVLVTPVYEEVAYRGVLQRAIVASGAGRWTAIAITSAVFAAAHGTVEVHALPLLFVVSLGFGWAYERTGRLAAAMMMHGAFNAANLSLALLTA